MEELSMPTATTSRVSDEGTRVARVASGRTREVARSASEEASNVASVAAERSGDIVRAAKEGARQLAGTVKAGEVTEQITSQARSLVGETRAQLQGQARAGTDRLAGGLRQFGEQAQALGEGRPEDAPQLTEYAWRLADSCYGAADKLHSLGEEIEQRGFTGVLDDLQTFARRRPGAFLLGAVAVGFGVGRLMKASGDESDEEDESVEGTTGTRAVPSRSRAVR
jgi:hypothetical protein